MTRTVRGEHHWSTIGLVLLAFQILLPARPGEAQIGTGGKGGGTGTGPVASTDVDYHVLERLTHGATDRDLEAIDRLGAFPWIREQLSPALIPEDPVLLAKLAALPPATTPLDDPLWEWPQLYADYFLRARYSARQLNEVMAEFWTNHFSTSLEYANGGRTGFFTSLAVDPSGRLAMAYWDSKNTVAHAALRTGSSWSRQSADPMHPAGRFTSIAIDPTTRQPAVALYEENYQAGKGNLRFTRFNGTAWTAEIVDSDGDVGTWTSLAFGGDGHPRIAYQDVTNRSLKLASHNGTAWTTATVDAPGDAGYSASLAMDKGDRPAIAYWDVGNGQLKLARSTDPGWDVQVVAPLPVVGIDLAADPAPPRVLSLRINPTGGRPEIAYYDTVRRVLQYAAHTGGKWLITTIDSSVDVGMHPSLTFNPVTNRPWVAYYDATTYALKVANFTGATWTVQTVPTDGHIAGEWCSLAFTSAGDPIVSYYDGSALAAAIVEWVGGKWQTSQVESLGTIRMIHTIWEKKESDAFRQNALGRFRDLLGASATSPAMMQYLNNDENVAGGGNENYARELMELHTLGVTGGYTQQDVESAARAFTGWSTNRRAPRCDVKRGDFCYNHLAHDGRARTVFGLDLVDDSANIPGNYMKQGTEILDFLARHPATARFICGKLIQKFVAETPPGTLLDRCSTTFVESDGDIARVLETILFSSEFFDPSRFLAKVKTPFEFNVGLTRNLEGETDGASLYDPTMWEGAELFRIPPPTGYDERGRYWVSSNSLLKRWRFADALTHGDVAGSSVDPAALVAARGIDHADAIVEHFLGKLVRGRATPIERALLVQELSAGDPSPLNLADPAVQIRIRDLVALIVGLPAYQKQ